MVVLFFAISKHNTSSYSNKEYAEHLKKGILKDDVKNCIGIDISSLGKDIQVSTLDNLLKTSDELIKVQHDFESFLKGLEKRLQELDPNFQLIVNLKNKQHKVKEAVLAFSWDDQKYPKSQKSINNLMEKLNEKLNSTKNNLKNKSDDYNSEIEKLKQKQKGDNEAKTYMKKDYREIIKDKTDLMIMSNYLTTLLVFVPNSNVEIFKDKYDCLVKDSVVPGSILKLCKNEDDKISLWRVVIMKHLKEEYLNELRKVVKANAKEFDKEEIELLPKIALEQKTIEANIQEKKSNLIQSMQSYFSEVYHATLHLLYLRMYTESNLKYGNNDYHSILVIPDDGKEQKITSSMIKKESDNHQQGWYGTKEELKESEDFFPFILLKLGVPLHFKD